MSAVCSIERVNIDSQWIEAQRCNLRSNRLAMVDDVTGAEILDPARRLWARGGRHYNKIGERADELDRDRAYPASAADDENRGGRARHRLADIHAVEQGFPRGDRCERQSRGLGKSERARLVPDNALVDEMKLSVGARADITARIEDLVARPEERSLWARLVQARASRPR